MKYLIILAVLLITAGSAFYFYQNDDNEPSEHPGNLSVGDDVYVSFKIDSESRRNFILSKVGSGNPDGKHHLATPAHLNPLGNLYTKPDYPFEIDRVKLRSILDEKKSYGLPMTMGIFAGKFFSSRVTDYLERNENNLMFDQFNQSILLDRVGGTYFAISPSGPGLPENEFLTIYERNTKAIAAEVAEFIRENPRVVVGVSFAGEVKYPPFKEGSKREGFIYHWADYGKFAMARYRQFLRDKYQNDFDAFSRAAELPPGTFSGFADTDPPRGLNRGAWDKLDDPANPYFLIWQEFRVAEVKNHIKQTVQWGKEAGIVEDDFTKIYSQQAIWEKEDSYYWRGAPIETLNLEGINPVVSLYGERTTEEDFIRRVGNIAKNYPGRWGSFQYNPYGPCAEDESCDPLGYPVEEYLRRLKLVEENGIRIISISEDTESGSDDEDENKHFTRENFYEAAKQFLAE